MRAQMPSLSNRAVIAFALAQLVLWGANYYAFSIFLAPMEQELGWSRAQLTGALSAGLLISALAGPLIGSWIDKGHGRRVMSAGALMAAAMYVLWAWSPSPFVFLTLWLGMGLAHAMVLYEAAFALLQRRQDDRAAAAITRVTLIAGFAGTVFFPLTQTLIDAAGWRITALAYAALNVLMALALNMMLRGEDHASSPAATETSNEGALVATLARPQFWLLALLFALLGIIFSVTVFHLATLFTERDLSARDIALVLALIGPAQVGGRLAMLSLGRAVPALWAGAIATCAYFAGFALLSANLSGVLAAALFCVLFGIGSGLSTILRGTAVAEFLSRRGFGVINGWVGMPATLARAAGPVTAAAIWTIGGSYAAVTLALWTAAALAAFTFAALLVVGRAQRAPA